MKTFWPVLLAVLAAAGGAAENKPAVVREDLLVAALEPARAIARVDNEGEGPAVFTAFYLLERNDRELIRTLDR